jgi:pilus assembly protein Flp/PilA
MLGGFEMPTRRRYRDDTGASAVEYGLLVAAVAAVTVIILFALGGAVRDMFSESCATIDDKVAPTAQCSP